MNEFLQELGTDCTRLAIASLLGGAIGLERQLHGQWAGIRTHMMVSLGAAIFIIAAITTSPDDSNDVTRVIQGIAAGIGFLGAGAILKLSTEGKVKPARSGWQQRSARLPAWVNTHWQRPPA